MSPLTNEIIIIIENKWRQTLEISELKVNCIKTDYENQIKKNNEEWAEKLKSTELSLHQLKQETNQNEVTIAVLNKVRNKYNN